VDASGKEKETHLLQVGQEADEQVAQASEQENQGRGRISRQVQEKSVARLGVLTRFGTVFAYTVIWVF